MTEPVQSIIGPEGIAKALVSLRGLISKGQKFNAILANIPWWFTDDGTILFEDIEALPIAEVTNDETYLLVWTPPHYVVKAFDLGKAWGFEQVMGGGIWIRHNSLSYVQASGRGLLVPKHDMFIVGMQSHMRLKPELEDGFGFEGDDPFVARNMVEGLTDGPYLELFGHYPAPPDWVISGTHMPVFGASLYAMKFEELRTQQQHRRRRK